MKHKKICLVLMLMLTLVLLASCASILPQPQSAYDVAVENGFKGSEADWLASIKGETGNDGNNGKSAYELYCEMFGYEGTEEQWLIDLRTGALISFKVTFDLDGGQAPEGFVSSITVRGGSFLDLKTPTKEGYTFLGWWTGEGDTDFAMTATTAVRSDLSLKAKWRSNVMSVRFLDKDGKLLKQETVSYGGAATAPEAPELSQFLFKKWDVDFSVVTEDLIVKAVYSPLYKLSFNTDGGTMIADATYSADEVPAVPVEPKKGNLVFRGWYADKEFTVPYDFTAPLTQNTTIHAYFSDMKPISNAEELRAIGDNSTGKFYLTNDINLGGEVWTPLVDFVGEFDGRGYKIYDFVISETKSAGFFTTNSGTIQNLTLSDFVFTVSTANTSIAFTAGALVGENRGIIENCHIKDAVLTYDNTDESTGAHTSYAGGVVGTNNGTITGVTIQAELKVYQHLIHGWNKSTRLVLHVGGIASCNNGNISGSTVDLETLLSARCSQDYSALTFGGLVSINIGEIVNCQSQTKAVIDSTRGNSNAHEKIFYAGFVQDNEGIVSQSAAVGSVQVMKNFYLLDVGGFVGLNSNQIKDCHAGVEVNVLAGDSQNEAIGGFVSRNAGTIASCYTTSTITSAANCPIGGFVGRNQNGGIISKSFASCNIAYTNAPSAVGLFVGVVGDGSALSKNYYNAENKILQNETDVTVADDNATMADLATLQSKAFLVDTLGWNAEVWEIVDGQYPTLIKGE